MSLKCVDELEDSLKVFLNILKSARTQVSQDQLEKVENDFKVANNFVKKIHMSVVSCCTQPVTWYPKERCQFIVTYVDGDSPWDFIVSHSVGLERRLMLKDIEKQWRSGSLTPADNLAVGSYVCCCSFKKYFRGVITDIDSSKKLVRLINIDDMREAVVVDTEMCYNLPPGPAIYANNMRCSLVTEKVNKSKWTPTLSTLVLNYLYNSTLTVRVCEFIETAPPTFVVELKAYNHDYCEEANISGWLNSKLIPAIEALDQKIMSFKDLNSYLDDSVTNPYYGNDDGISARSHQEEEATKLPLTYTDMSLGSPKEKPFNRLAQIAQLERTNEVRHRNPFQFKVDLPEFNPHTKDSDVMNTGNLNIVGSPTPTDDESLVYNDLQGNYPGESHNRLAYIAKIEREYEVRKKYMFHLKVDVPEFVTKTKQAQPILTGVKERRNNSSSPRISSLYCNTGVQSENRQGLYAHSVSRNRSASPGISSFYCNSDVQSESRLGSDDTFMEGNNSTIPNDNVDNLCPRLLAQGICCIIPCEKIHRMPQVPGCSEVLYLAGSSAENENYCSQLLNFGLCWITTCPKMHKRPAIPGWDF